MVCCLSRRWSSVCSTSSRSRGMWRSQRDRNTACIPRMTCMYTCMVVVQAFVKEVNVHTLRLACSSVSCLPGQHERTPSPLASPMPRSTMHNLWHCVALSKPQMHRGFRSQKLQSPATTACRTKVYTQILNYCDGFVGTHEQGNVSVSDDNSTSGVAPYLPLYWPYSWNAVQRRSMGLRSITIILTGHSPYAACSSSGTCASS